MGDFQVAVARTEGEFSLKVRQARRLMPLAPIAAAFAMVFCSTSTAHAVEWDHTISNHVYNPDDRDGDDASISLYTKGEPAKSVRARFDAYGEVLTVWDRRQDGELAVAWVFVYNRSGTRVDTDTFSTGDDHESFNLGTPDGSGDIPEGYTVKINVCVGDVMCAATAEGTA